MKDVPTVLIVDDSRIIRRKIERCLGDRVEVVAQAANGENALQRYRDLRPDMVTMDITMPEMDGVTCIRRIREHDPKALILVVSALADRATALEAVKSGAVGFLLKPFSEADFERAMNHILKRIAT